MTTLEYEILSAIDNIGTVTMEAEMNVLLALCNEYEKSAVILENYEGEDVSCFDIFQESTTSDGVKKDNKVKHTLFDRFIQFFKNAITKISLRVLDIRFDSVLKRLHKIKAESNDGAVLVSEEIHAYQSWDDVFDNVDIAITNIEEMLDHVKSWIKKGINDDAIPFNYEGMQEFLNGWNDENTMGYKKETIDGKVEYVGVDKLIDVITKQKTRLAETKSKINELLKNLNKFFDTKFDQEYDVKNLALYKKLMSSCVRFYINACKVLINRSNEIIKINDIRYHKGDK